MNVCIAVSVTVPRQIFMDSQERGYDFEEQPQAEPQCHIGVADVIGISRHNLPGTSTELAR